MTNEIEIGFAEGPIAVLRNGNIQRRIILRIDGQNQDVVLVNLDAPQTRNRLAADWSKRFNIDAALFREKLSKAAVFAAAEVPNEPEPEINRRPADDSSRSKPSQADRLIELIDDCTLFHTSGDDAETYATVPISGHLETHAISRRSFRRLLAGRYWAKHNKAVNSQSIQDAISVIVSMARYHGSEFPVAVPVAEHEADIYLDLCDPEWRAVCITPAGWEIVDNPPVKFVRPRGMRALPAPVSGGSVDELREFVNTSTDGAWAFMLSWLIAAFRATGPFPILTLYGEQGSAKSTCSRIVRALIDPNEAPLRSEPRDPRDLMIAAQNAWLLVFDNLSTLPPILSDGLCRLATGGGFSTRQLFTDGEEKLFNSMRPVILNGISEIGWRGDLLDRVVVLTLPPITSTARRTEGDLWESFEAAQPRILGSLLDAVAYPLKELPNVHLHSKPRMADFAQWSVAAEPALGLRPGLFLESYGTNRVDAIETAIEASPVGAAVVAFAQDRQLWSGSASQLLTELEADAYTDERLRKRREWPKTARAISSALRRICPQLRAFGIEVSFTRKPDRSRGRIIQIEQGCISSSTPSTPSTPSKNGPDDPENAVSSRTEGIWPTVHTSRRSSEGIVDIEPETPVADEADGVDAKIPPYSDSGPEGDPAYEFDEAELLQFEEEANA